MQDYKYIRYESEKRKTKSKRSKKTSLLILIVLLILIGAGCLFTETPIGGRENRKKIVKEHNQVKASEQSRLTFYDILARDEIVMKPDVPVEIKENQVYIQLGAFQNDIDDNFEAKMRLLDLHTQVQSLSLPDKGGRWFIVRIGPIKDDIEMSMIKTQLTQNQVEYAVVT